LSVPAFPLRWGSTATLWEPSNPQGLTYGYDALERLVSVRQAGVLIARYGYDVAGRRIVKRVYSGATGGTVGYLRMGYAGA